MIVFKKLVTKDSKSLSMSAHKYEISRNTNVHTNYIEHLSDVLQDTIWAFYECYIWVSCPLDVYDISLKKVSTPNRVEKKNYKLLVY